MPWLGSKKAHHDSYNVHCPPAKVNSRVFLMYSLACFHIGHMLCLTYTHILLRMWVHMEKEIVVSLP